MSRTYRRRRHRYEYRWVLRDWKNSPLPGALLLLNRHSQAGRRAIARFHSDSEVTLRSTAPRWYRKIFDHRLRTSTTTNFAAGGPTRVTIPSSNRITATAPTGRGGNQQLPCLSPLPHVFAQRLVHACLVANLVFDPSATPREGRAHPHACAAPGARRYGSRRPCQGK